MWPLDNTNPSLQQPTTYLPRFAYHSIGAEIAVRANLSGRKPGFLTLTNTESLTGGFPYFIKPSKEAIVTLPNAQRKKNGEGRGGKYLVKKNIL